MGMHVVMFGNPIDGLQIVGPFKTADDACQWADLANLSADWWIAPLQAKEAFEVDGDDPDYDENGNLRAA